MSESPGKTEVVVGVFYETPSGEIARTFGWNGRTREISYYLDDGEGGRTVTEVGFASWKPRRDLADFPNARDPRLPYEFDLFWDAKHLSELSGLLENADPAKEREIRDTMARHGIALPESVQDQGAKP